jgi:GT2 family glycosyltransferase/ubiquinone/menaquinone biosynthesis C-methylase UbiE
VLTEFDRRALVDLPTGSAAAASDCVVVIPSWDGVAVLGGCLDAVAAQTTRPARVIVIDNGSEDGTRALLARDYPWVDVIHLAMNTGFANAVNCGIRASSQDLVVLLNNDARPESGWLEALVDASRRNRGYAFLTSKLLDETGTIVESTGDFLDWSGVPRQRDHGSSDEAATDSVTEVFSGCGGATLYRRSMLNDVGLFDTRFFAYYEDVDLCFRAQLRGHHGAYVPSARVRHIGSATSNKYPGMKVRLSVRNNWWLVLKNAPLPLLPRMLAGLALANTGTAVHAAKADAFRAYLRGNLEALGGAHAVLRDRRIIQRQRASSNADIARRIVRADVVARVMRKLARAMDRVTLAAGREPVNPDSALRYLAARRVVSTVGGTILEVGSGNGGLTTYLDRPVVGLDRSFVATSDVRPGRITHVQGDAARLPFGDGAFSVVLSIDMLEHVTASDRPAVLREMVRVTRSGGVLLIAAPMGEAARQRDDWLAALWQRRFGRPNPWIAEHIEFGLPQRSQLEAALSGADVASWRVRGNVLPPWWSLLHWLQAYGVTSSRLNRLLVRLSPPAPARWCYRLIYEIRP